MTVGARPLRHYLHPESHKYQLTLQRYIYHYLDLVKEFAKCFPSMDVPASLDQMAESILLIYLCSVYFRILLKRGQMLSAKIQGGGANPNPRGGAMK